MATLIIDTGTGSELSFEFEDEAVSIGASSTNDVVLRSPGVAPSHLVIRRSGDRYTFLGQQRQVVLVNGKRRARGVIGEGDRIRIGSATLFVRAPEAGAAPAAEVPGAELPAAAASEATTAAPGVEPARPRAEVVLFNEPARLATARRQMLKVFQEGMHDEVTADFEELLGGLFAGRRAMVAWLDQQGRLQPLASHWSGAVPQLPERTFSELERGDRVAMLRGAGPELLIYPISAAGTEARAYVLAETSDDDLPDDRTLVAELANLLAVNWQDFAASSSLLGKWEAAARARIEDRLPGSSAAVRTLREEVLAAARSAHPVLLHGSPGSGRAFLGSLIASLRPTGRPWIRVLQVRGGDDQQVAAELFGSATAIGARGLAEHAGGGVVVIRDVHRMSPSMQVETAAAIGQDIGAGFGARVRWIMTADSEAVAGGAAGSIAAPLIEIAGRHLVRVPSLTERREDLPLLIVRLLEAVGAEQGKEIRGIELDTLDSLLTHSFTGEMSELLGELRRLVSATAEGQVVRGEVRSATPAAAAGALQVEDAPETAAVLEDDDLKVVIPAVERLLIDRVLRRAKGNQSRAARELNLSRGALIAKIKDYDIPDYRSLRRK